MNGILAEALEDLTGQGAAEDGASDEPFQYADQGFLAPNEPAFEGAADVLDEQMSEAERRLAKATLYRHFLVGRVFQGDNDPTVQEVEAEFRAFAREKLGHLLGVGTPPPPAVFDPDEVLVLKALAATVKNKVGGARRPAAPAAPPSKPPPVQVPRAPARPQLRPRQLPEGVRSQVAPAPPQPLRPAPRPQPQSRPQQQQQPRPQLQKPAAPAQPSRVPADGEVVEEKGRVFKIRWREMSPSEYGDAAERRLMAAPPGATVRLANGMVVVKTEGEEYFKVVRQDVTPQVSGTGGVPFPGVDQMMGITAAMSAAATRLLPTDANKVAEIVNGQPQ